jgi:uncharacterized surface protein with fasciclin (FAS1) repeats
MLKNNMKKIRNYILQTAYGSAFLLSLISCEKDTVDPNPSVQPPKSVAEIITSDRDFSWLEAALDRANLTGTLASGTFTVFAPTNNSFKSSGIDSLGILATDPTVLATILRGHILNSSAFSKDIPTGINKSLTTQGATAFSSNFVLDGGSYGVGVNGARVSFADIVATNGAVHKMDAVIAPATSTVIATLQANPDFSLLIQALTKAGLNAALGGADPLTIFAPTNDAFAAAGIDVAFITAASAADLADILSYHVISGRIFTTNFAPAAVVSGSQFAGAIPFESNVKETLLPLTKNTVLGYSYSNNVLAFTDNEDRIAGKTKSSKATVKNILTRTNIAATNGVIHAIDKVLSPANKTIVALLSDPKFSLLIETATRANLVVTLTTTSPLTVFAPTDDAFIAYWKINPVLTDTVLLGGVKTAVSRPKTTPEIKQEAKDSINSKTPAQMAALVQYHAVGSRLFSNTLVDGDLTMLSGEKATIAGATITSKNETTAAKITNVDLGATNGIVHIIDRVLKP